MGKSLIGGLILILNIKFSGSHKYRFETAVIVI